MKDIILCFKYCNCKFCPNNRKCSVDEEKYLNNKKERHKYEYKSNDKNTVTNIKQ